MMSSLTNGQSDALLQNVAIPHFDFEIAPKNLKQEFVPVLKKIRPNWNTKDLHFSESPLNSERGLLNTMITCYHSNDHNDAIMVRIFYTKVAGAMFDRNAEVAAVKYFSGLDCGPKILATYNNGFCYQYIEGDVLCRERMGEELIWRGIAEEFAKVHAGQHEDELINRDNLVIINLIRRYAQSFPVKLKKPDYNKRFQNEYAPVEILREDVTKLLDHVATMDSPVVLCHNDTRAENIIWNKDKRTIHFVDFEAVGYNYQAMDIAMHFVRFAGLHQPDYSLYPDDEFRISWLKSYLTKYYQLCGRNANDVTQRHVQRLYIQVEKFRLLTLLFYAVAGPSWANHFDYISSSQVDLMALAINSLKEYFALKEKIMNLELPALN